LHKKKLIYYFNTISFKYIKSILKINCFFELRYLKKNNK